MSRRLRQLRLFDRNRVANADAAAGDHLGIDPAIAMAEPALQRGRDVEVAHGALWIDVDGGAADDPLDDPEPRIADGKRLAEQFELAPGRPAADIEVGAKPQRM